MDKTQDSFNKDLSPRVSSQRNESLARKSKLKSDSQQNLSKNDDEKFPNFQVEAKFEMNISVGPADEEPSDSENKMQSKTLDVKCVATYREAGKDGTIEIQKNIPPEETVLQDIPFSTYEPRPSRSAPYPDGLHKETSRVRPSSGFGRTLSASTQCPSDFREAPHVRQDSVRPSSAFGRMSSASSRYPSDFREAPHVRQDSARPSSAFGRTLSESSQYPSDFREAPHERQDNVRPSSAFGGRVSSSTQYPSDFLEASPVRQDSFRPSLAFERTLSASTQYPSVLHEWRLSAYEHKFPETITHLNEATQVPDDLRLSQSRSPTRSGFNKAVPPYMNGDNASIHPTHNTRFTVENPNKLERGGSSRSKEITTEESVELQDKGPITAVRISLDKDVLLELHPLFPWQEMQVALDDGPVECTCCTSCK